MGFAGNVSKDRQRVLIEKALDEGRALHKRTNIGIEFHGEAYPLSTFEGPAWVASGLMQFYHYGSRVMAVDFTHDKITDFGYTGHSMTTNTYLNTWKRVLGNMDFQGVECLRSETDPFRWTATNLNYYFARGAGHAKEMFMRFCAGVPWVKNIDGKPWFFGRRYDAALEDRFDEIRSEILRDGVSWHWWTGDWDSNGHWVKRFIDTAAEKRWEKRQAKLIREQERHRTAYGVAMEAAAT